ncbi:hypothetical protein YA0852_31455 [Pseudomonas synxantha]|jgi:hypothetical protein|uniref:Uncharacterized protein n=1 Tax=Pseudomonas synxantha TaxID=47883 RepID=A0ABS0UVK0_9PSED|nr:hypothetical protein [Pseudomonas synxantha]MBI6568585.1 hypothetical protein [Pseudomonas synxantha]MBI6584779.1 hypothetical protein [Pseudomonas synxantha]
MKIGKKKPFNYYNDEDPITHKKTDDEVDECLSLDLNIHLERKKHQEFRENWKPINTDL